MDIELWDSTLRQKPVKGVVFRFAPFLTTSTQPFRVLTNETRSSLKFSTLPWIFFRWTVSFNARIERFRCADDSLIAEFYRYCHFASKPPGGRHKARSVCLWHAFLPYRATTCSIIIFRKEAHIFFWHWIFYLNKGATGALTLQQQNWPLSAANRRSATPSAQEGKSLSICPKLDSFRFYSCTAGSKNSR